MRFITVALTAAASLSSLAMADNCTPGLLYCGFVLLRRGNYYEQIVRALDREGLMGDPHHVQQTLFHCDGGPNGDIHVLKECLACQDGGNGHNDIC